MCCIWTRPPATAHTQTSRFGLHRGNHYGYYRSRSLYFFLIGHFSCRAATFPRPPPRGSSELSSVKGWYSMATWYFYNNLSRYLKKDSFLSLILRNANNKAFSLGSQIVSIEDFRRSSLLCFSLITWLNLLFQWTSTRKATLIEKNLSILYQKVLFRIFHQEQTPFQ